MPQLDPIAIAIPVFIGAIGVEAFLARRRGLHIYRFFDAMTDLSCGIGNQALGVFNGIVIVGLYASVYRHASLIHFAPGSIWPWLIGFVGLDFLYYWWHRASHEVNFLWAAHIVHHQSEDYNLAVALRQALFTSYTSLPFYLPLALLGVRVEIFVLSNAVSLLYQFWIHTELINRIDPVEGVLNTPSHHRVHHATNPEYLDKNYGAILITWDRMFGTFEPERAACVYGLTHPFTSLNPIWANFHYWFEIVERARKARGALNKLLTPFRGPGWNEETHRVELPKDFVPRDRFHKHVPPRTSRGMRIYINANFLLLAGAVMALLLFHHQLPMGVLAVSVTLIFATTLGWSALFEQRSWARPFEAVRIVGTVVALVWIGRVTQLV